jgi:hypothetical protein
MSDILEPPFPPEGEKKGVEGVDWFWVITSPITIFRDKMLVLEVDGLSLTPTFRTREAGAAFLKRLDSKEWHEVQAMHVQDIMDFKTLERLAVVTLDGEGKVLEVWEKEGVGLDGSLGGNLDGRPEAEASPELETKPEKEP